MGVYDIFSLEINCPKCDNRFVTWAQTKSLHCEMKTYEIGDPIEWPNDEIFVYSWCDKCEKEIYQGIRIEGGFVKEKTESFMKGELPGGLDRWFGELYFPSSVAECLQIYRYEQVVEKLKTIEQDSAQELSSFLEELEEEKNGTTNDGNA